MNLNRVHELRAELEAERIDLSELSEIEMAFAEVPDHALRDLRENAMAGDQLDEIEDWLHFSAVLAKNYIAEELASDELNKSFIMAQLEDIENYIGTSNQPTARDCYETGRK